MKIVIVTWTIFLFIFSGLSTNIFANSNIINDKETNNDTIFLYHNDELDQSQTNQGVGGQFFHDNFWAAQQFKPTLNVLTRIFLNLCKEGNPPNDIIISIRDNLSGSDLINITISKDIIPEFPYHNDWFEADFNDIIVNPGQFYYIVACSSGGNFSNSYLWWNSGGNPYFNGGSFYSQSFGNSWGEITNFDFCFKTYGYNFNDPPGKPIINGPNIGKPGDIYSCSLIATDPDNDSIYYEIDWGDGIVIPWDGPYESNEKISKDHVYLNRANFTIMARVKDSYGNIGEWGELKISIPRNKIDTNIFLQKFFQNNPYLLQLIQKLLNN